MGSCVSVDRKESVAMMPVTSGAPPARPPPPAVAVASAGASVTMPATDVIRSGDRLQKDFTLVKKLGAGAFATVHEGLEKSTGILWAVKLIELAKLKMDEDRWMLENEVEILRRVHHPNITSLHAVYRDDRLLSLVMGLCKGGELFDEIVKRGKYSEEDARRIVVQIVDAVAYLHEHKIVHRDIKPENLLLVDHTADSPVQLTDFGLSGIIRNTDMTMFVGTPQYMAPEMIDAKEYGPPVDMWSIGVVIFVLLGGYLPFDADKEEQLFALIRSGHPAYNLDSHLWSHVSPTAKDLLSKLFVVDPARRLTARQALQHPWLQNVAADTHMAAALVNLSRYNARRRLKMAMHSARAIVRMARVAGMSPRSGSDTNLDERDGGQLDESAMGGAPIDTHRSGADTDR